MRWVDTVRELSLRTKVAITVGGAVIILLGGASYLTFRYWESEALAAARQQALLAGRSVRASVETGLAYDRREEAKRSLRRLTEGASVTGARVYGSDGTILLSSSPAEEGRGAGEVWIPDPREIPRGGVVRQGSDGDEVRAYLPLGIPGAAVLEVQLSAGPVREAMDRGARLGLGLTVASVLALAVIVLTMMEREVVSPIRRLEGLLAGSGKVEPGGELGELERLGTSIERLIRREEAAERLAEARHRRLARQEGLVKVGELAAEMAHEFKRPLVNIRTAVDVLEQEYRLDERGERVLSQVEGQLDRLRETMGDLFSLAQPVELDTREVDVAEVLDDALLQLRGDTDSEEVEIRREYEPDLPPVEGEPRRLEQAFLNLMLNASEAMSGRGVLTVSARTSGNGWLEVSVADTGPGIPEEQIPEVTRPFYSTKPMGTGLGLPLVARIVSAHGGRLRIESTRDEGTTIHVRIPTRTASS